MSIALPLYKIFPTKVYRKLNTASDAIYDVGRELLDNIIEKKKSEGARQIEEDAPVSFVEQWLAEGKLTNGEILAQATDTMVGGTDSVSTTVRGG